ncbi:hypothetical protein [Chroococcidiopsis sp. TS-821]|nr:hypothetical protein [Chroococcidiopsis sp. TS-821]
MLVEVMMQLLAQDLMLLALDNEKGRVVSSAAASLPYGLIGAAQC